MHEILTQHEEIILGFALFGLIALIAIFALFTLLLVDGEDDWDSEGINDFNYIKLLDPTENKWYTVRDDLTQPVEGMKGEIK